MNKDIIKELFINYFGDTEKIHTFFSPGRVNLIGEHIDYNGGFVFPAALSIGIYAAMSEREDFIIKLKSNDVAGEVTIDLRSEIKYDSKDGWGNYPKGVIKYICDMGYELKGCNIYYGGNLPDGAGLSSSAAIEVLTAFIIMNLLKTSIDRVEIAKICQNVENDFIKVNCGIMDQFSVAMGKKDMAILLDCDTLKYEYVPIKLNDFSLVIMNTNKKRGLADSKYNERRKECQDALDIIRGVKNINNLCEATFDDLCLFTDRNIFKRAKHVICENERVKRAVEVLKEGNLSEFGQLLIQSHNSLKDDYEVTGFELDSIVEAALQVEGCIGARMTGAGFGGCAIALVKNDCIEKFKKDVTNKYYDKTKLTPDFYVSVIDDGVKMI